MARYNSDSTEEPGQYPTTAWSQMGLPEQSYGSGAPGTGQGGTDAGARGSMAFTGVRLDGTGAPGGPGVSSSGGGADSVTYSRNTYFKGEHDPGGMEQGAITYSTGATVSGRGDWTQANDEGYQAADRFQMPGVAGNTPGGGDTKFQTGAGSVMYGGRLNGTGHTSQHPSWSGPGS